MNKELLTELFSTDKDLLSIYHIEAPNSAEVCAERTLKDIEGSDIFLFKNEDKVIGYYGIKGSQLAGFFITPENRNKQVMSKFWTEIENKFTKDFYCGLYTKNTRAINFIRKQSTEEFPVTSSNGVFFRIKR
jgi:hypothetical protein